ncbi:hypothetical protein EP331_13550 [bacterium]|nr:MAG: hypothetical protein EP331_13550 [bacterium]
MSQIFWRNSVFKAFLIDKNEPLQSRLFKSSLIACSIAATLLFIHDLTSDFFFVDAIAELTGVCISLSIFFLAKKETRVKSLTVVFVFAVLVLLDISWLGNKGLGIGHSLYFLALLVISIIIVDGKSTTIFLIIFSINMIGILVTEYVNPEFYYIGVHNRMEPVTTKSVFLVISYTIIAWAVLFLKQQYNEAFELNRKKNEEIDSQKKQIELQNQTLELKVEQRTSHIEKQNEQLLEYAFLNSHKVRAPLSNILAILEIIQHSQLNSEELVNLHKMLVVESERLDSEIRTVQDSIHHILSIDSRFNDSNNVD